ncbi:hypothetical protein PO80_02525 [Vibrio parahaemolyticus]|uniref:DUF481 domain-containing protein n=1 Tax=Vibrio parahaemolyticus TaxID=670 RepID=UPI000543135B|nr:DUF481 domain-containing protein [Vibrio parahaemolyticus]ELU8562257.1 DUF481 domain-containing protein [Vibrio parahaemolyticus]KHF17371.1 hypothetical protein PO80_02525 [Vibrio parahaemolyticus]OTV96542.1 hypothetical protein BA739_23195 [Vibrio parahaemolyticus]OTV99056.1 hypothetical protein BA740_24380 [Vibrio parahaemolyticus]
MKLLTTSLFITLSSMQTTAFANELTETQVTDKPNGQTVYFDNNDDWVKLKSGEVIKGELNGTIKKDSNSYKQEIEFDSDDLGAQEIELGDIQELQTAGCFTIRVVNGGIYDGYLSIRDSKLYMTNSIQEVSFPVTEIVSIYRGQEKDSEQWDVELNFSMDLSSGNTDELTLRGSIDAERNTVESRTKLNASHETKESNDETIAKNSQISGSYDVYINNRLFFRPLDLMVKSDEFQNLDYKITASVGVGYFFIANDTTEWDVTIGPAYSHTKFKTTEERNSSTTNSGAFKLDSSFDYELTKSIDFTYDYSMVWETKQSGGIRYTNKVGFDIDLLDDLDLSIDSVWDHISNPTAGSNGRAPYKNDYKTFIGLSYKM